MKHLTANEIIDFISMTELDDKSLKNAAVVTGHITECEVCLRKVRAFQVIFDELVELGLNADSKHELYKMIESEVSEESKPTINLKTDYTK